MIYHAYEPPEAVTHRLRSPPLHVPDGADEPAMAACHRPAAGASGLDGSHLAAIAASGPRGTTDAPEGSGGVAVAGRLLGGAFAGRAGSRRTGRTPRGGGPARQNHSPDPFGANDGEARRGSRRCMPRRHPRLRAGPRAGTDVSCSGAACRGSVFVGGGTLGMKPLLRAGQKAPLWLLVLITISGTLAMHMFIPALPAAGRDFGASVAAMQLTISVYILGLAGGQLVYGPLSDAFGRRPLLIVGLALYVVAGLAAAVATNVHTLVAARLFQALGGCAGLVLGRAIVRDTAPAGEAVRDLALLNLVMMIGPGLAPLLGPLLVVGLGWRSIFVLLAALGAATFLFSWRLLPETGRPTHR